MAIQLRKEDSRSSWECLSSNISLLEENNINQSDIVIGVFDDGIDPSSPCFDPTTFNEIPKHWKPTTDGVKLSNNKLLGVRVYTPSDDTYKSDGHGTLCAAIAAGNEVPIEIHNTICKFVGHLPRARLAIYKVIKKHANVSDQTQLDYVAQAFFDAMDDGVDVISTSLSNKVSKANSDVPTSSSPTSCSKLKKQKILPKSEDYESCLEVGSFNIKSKTLVCASVSTGRDGSSRNTAPWLLTVGSSCSQYAFFTELEVRVCGTQDTCLLKTRSLNVNGTNGYFRIIFDNEENRPVNEVRGEGAIVICYCETRAIKAVERGIQGFIMMQFRSVEAVDGLTSDSEPKAYIVGKHNHETFTSFLEKHSGKRLEAQIFPSKEEEDDVFPTVATYSSNMPNASSKWFLKPDICAPGTHVLTTKCGEYKFICGSSVSTPIVAATVAAFKSLYPGLSPAAYKSAVMTTASTISIRDNEREVFGMGSGVINPSVLMNPGPGLIYDITDDDYDKWSRHELQDWDLNLPSFAAFLTKDMQEITFHRELKNITSTACTFTQRIRCDKKTWAFIKESLKVKIEPKVLVFDENVKTQKFTLTIKTRPKFWREDMPLLRFRLQWRGGPYVVRSPVVIYKQDHVEKIQQRP